jgi:CRISPR-associated protein Csb2
MPFAIMADLPLGTYHGAGPDGQPEQMPSVARLHAALLSAAGSGPRAVSAGGAALEVCEQDRAALGWLEEHPPDSIHIPALEINIAHATAYRNDGTIRRSKSVASIRKLAKSAGGGAAVGGCFAWIWREPPPPEVRGSLEQLCPDVAYLGTSESPVRLTAGTADRVEATADLDETAGLFSTGVTSVLRPVRGRTGELVAAHRAASGKPPSAARDRVGTAEKSLSPVPPRGAVATARYRHRERPAVQAPWPTAMVLPLDRPVGEQYRVGWAVAAHRALVKLTGYGAPPLLTGAYPPGARPPANRLALHVLGPETPSAPVALRDAEGQPRSALLVLVPGGADAGDLEALQRALAGLTSLRGPRGALAWVDRARMQVLDGGEFWLPPAPGRVRLWETVPAAVPDTRGHDGWTFADAARLSLGFVWKGHLPQAGGRGEQRDRTLADAVSGLGAAVVHVRAERTSEVGRYAHKVHEHAVVRPYRAVISLGGLGGDRVVQAIGQSRHLGGGLLIPRDVLSAPSGDAAATADRRAGGGEHGTL